MKKHHFFNMQFIARLICLICFAVILGFVPAEKAGAAAPSVALNAAKQSIGKGDYFKLELKWIGKNDTVKWSSGNKKVATVTKDGMVYGKSAGKTTITAKCKGKTYKCVITVNKTAAKTYQPGEIFESGDWVYYLDHDSISRNEAGMGGYLCKMKKDGSGKKTLSTDTCTDIAVADGYVYYIKHSSTDGYMTNHDRVLIRIKTDGSDKKTIFSNEKKCTNYVINGNDLYVNDYGNAYKLNLKTLKSENIREGINTAVFTFISGRLFFTEVIANDNSLGIKVNDAAVVQLLQSINPDGSGLMPYGVVSSNEAKKIVNVDGMLYYANGDDYLVRRKLDGTGSVEKITKASGRIALEGKYIYAFDASTKNVTRTNIKTLDTEVIASKVYSDHGVAAIYNNIVFVGSSRTMSAVIYNGKSWEIAGIKTIAANIGCTKQKALPEKLIGTAITRITSSDKDFNCDVFKPINNVNAALRSNFFGREEELIFAINEGDESRMTKLAWQHAGPDAYITYKSSDPKIASVNKDGLLVCKAPGTVTISSTVNLNYTQSLKVVVKDRGFDQDTYELEVGETVFIKTYATAKDKVSAFKIKDTGIADFTGKDNALTGYKAGTTTITFTNETIGKTFTATIIVKAHVRTGKSVEEVIADSKTKEKVLDDWGLTFARSYFYMITAADDPDKCVSIKGNILKTGQAAVYESDEPFYIALGDDPASVGGGYENVVRRIYLPEGTYHIKPLYLTIKGGEAKNGAKLVWAEEAGNISQSFGFAAKYDNRGKYLGTAIWVYGGYYVKVDDGELVLTDKQEEETIFRFFIQN